jgi:hypothetical protein
MPKSAAHGCPASVAGTDHDHSQGRPEFDTVIVPSLHRVPAMKIVVCWHGMNRRIQPRATHAIAGTDSRGGSCRR